MKLIIKEKNFYPMLLSIVALLLNACSSLQTTSSRTPASVQDKASDQCNRLMRKH